MNSVCCIVFLLIGGQGEGLARSDGMTLELKALEARRSLHNGVIELSVDFLKSDQPPSIPAVELRIHFDGNRLLAERHERDGSRTELRMYDGSRYVRATGEDNERILIDSRGTSNSTYYLLDPRLLGMYPLSFPALSHHSKHSLDTVLGRTDRTDEKVSVERLSGRSVTHISRKVLSGQVLSELWIDPELNYSVVRMEVVASTFCRAELLSEYDKPFGNVWFPNRITYRQYQLPDNQLTNEEVVTVKSAVFNQGVDQSLFTLAAFKPTLGEVVNKDGVRLAWNGKGLIPAYGREALALASPSRFGRWPWFAAALLMALAAFFLLRRWLLSVRNP